MPTVHFKGRIFPTRGLSFQNIPQVRWKQDATDLLITATMRIQESVVEIECEMNRYAPTDFEGVHLHVFDFARTFVDFASFSMGTGLTMVLDAFTGPEGATASIRSHDPGLSSLCSVGLTQEVVDLLIKDKQVALALNELTSTLERPYELPVNCARAVERLSHLITPNAGKKKRWIGLQQHLNLSENYVHPIAELSEGPRHGDPQMPLGTDMVEMRKRAWAIFDRYIHFRLNGGQQLPLATFQLLI